MEKAAQDHSGALLVHGEGIWDQLSNVLALALVLPEGRQHREADQESKEFEADAAEFVH